MTITERDVITEFLKLYKDQTCLWDTSNKLYNDRSARKEAYELLRDKLQLIDPNSTVVAVRKRIENMRAAYKREFKKIQQSKLSGAEQVYVPTLWYYDYLQFLDERDGLNPSAVDAVSTFDEHEAYETESKPCIKRRATIVVKTQEKHPESEPNLPVQKESSAQQYGRAVGMQLDEMANSQRCIAERLISEVVFYGKLGQLTVHSRVALNKDSACLSVSSSPASPFSSPAMSPNRTP